ncbi:MAG: potassium transporter TrkG [Pseudomonadota bacterium]
MRWRDVPLPVYLSAVAGLAMLVPMIYATAIADWESARTFLYFSIAVLVLSVVFALARMNRAAQGTAITHLFVLLGAYIALPVLLALPMLVLVPTVTPIVAYFEMLSAMTTTGFTVFETGNELSRPLHLWKATVAWLGGYLIILAAMAIMAPLRIGGFEIRTLVDGNAGRGLLNQTHLPESTERLLRNMGYITPVYVVLTAAIAILLLVSGKDGFVALCLALSIMSTSGLSPEGGAIVGQGTMLTEAVMLMGMIFAATSMFFDINRRPSLAMVRQDPELKVLLAFAVALPAALFLRHWVGALEVESESSFGLAVEALWGSIFTVVSFITTTGYESVYWESAQQWSGLPTPGLILLALAAVGGGVASTAGGIKLLRVYALYKQGVREIERLVLPSSVAGAGAVARSIRRQGAFIAWLFLMLFLFSIALVMLALSSLGLAFEDALYLSVSALSNVGPGYTLMAAEPLRIRDLDPAAHVVLCFAMVLGRLEALAVIALINPGFWRR